MEEAGVPNSKTRSLWSPLALVFCIVYADIVLGLMILRALLDQWPPLLALINSSGPLLFAPLLVALPLALVIRSRMAVLSSLIVLGLFLISYAPFFLPRFKTNGARTDAKVTAMTFNLGFDHPRPQQLVQVIEHERADIVAVQELEPSTAELLEDELKPRYPYRILDPDTDRLGLLSRYPIVSSEWFHLAGDGKTALHAVLDVHDLPIHVFVAHPRPPNIMRYRGLPLPLGLYDAAHQRAVTDIALRASASAGPVLVLGDLNMSDQTRGYSTLASVLKDAYREAGWGFGFTFPNGLRIIQRGFPIPGPLVRIDYIFHSEELYTEWARVGCSGGSDHCYLIARISALSSAMPALVTKRD